MTGKRRQSIVGTKYYELMYQVNISIYLFFCVTIDIGNFDIADKNARPKIFTYLWISW